MSSTLEPKLSRYFHVLDPGTGLIVRQGKIIKRHRGGWFTVECYSWLDGTPNGEDDIHISVMKDGNWVFYNFSDEMQRVSTAEWRKLDAELKTLEDEEGRQ